MEFLADVKNGLGITGDYHDSTLLIYIDEVVQFLTEAGVKGITSGLVVRGVADLWNYGGAKGELSKYFYQRATQLSYKRGSRA